MAEEKQAMDKTATITTGTENKETPPKQHKKKYGFRLTPHEQELAYEMKAGMMRKLDDLNGKLQTELLVQRRMQNLQKENKHRGQQKQDDHLTRLNAIKLMRMYERRAIQAESRCKKLENDLNESQDLAFRYRERFLSTKEAAGSRPATATASRQEQDQAPERPATTQPVLQQQEDSQDFEDKKDRPKITDKDLDDDKAVFQRHITKLAETKSMRTTTSIRIQDVIRKNEVLLIENENLRQEVQRLKADNARFLKESKLARHEKDQALHQYGTSEAARRDLLKRLEKEQKKSKLQQQILNQQASNWVTIQRGGRVREEQIKWSQVGPVSAHAAEERTYVHPVKKNVYMPRKMYPVEEYAS